MASDITLAVGGGSRRMTYAELATVRGISLPSARRLVLRHRWPRQRGNDGVVRILVPLGMAKKSSETAAFGPDEAVTTTVALSQGDMSEGQRDMSERLSEVTPSDVTVTAQAFEAALAILREQIDHERAGVRELLAAKDARIVALEAEIEARQQWTLWRRLRGR